MDQPAEPHAIFDNDLLRDKIIGYFSRDKTKAGKENIANYRLVNKLWLQSVSRVLRKSQEPLFRIFLQPGNFSFGSKYYSKWTDKPDEILRKAMGCYQQDDPVPPYSIGTSRIFMSDHRLLGCLTNCGSSLVKLNLSLLADPVPIPVNDIFLLPRLQSFEVEYFQQTLYDSSDEEDKRIDYTQRILDASANLKSLLIYCSFKDQQLPDCVSHLKFPASITELHFDCVMNDCKLEILAKNWMPNLKTLKFLVNKTPFQQQLIGRILANVRKTLKTLHVGETSLYTANKSPTTFQLPVMEKLETIHIETAYFALEEMFLWPLRKFAPALRHMVLTRQTDSMFRQWAKNSDFHLVESLTVSLVTGEHDNNGLDLDTARPLNFDLHTMEMLKRAFPNLLQLDITISAAEPTALVFIMEEMKNLRHLCIRTLASPNVVTSSHMWDSLLIGVPVESMVELEKSPESWKQMQLLYSDLPSIRNLNDLQTLELVGPDTKVFKKYPLISKASFDFAFLKMPNLGKFIWSRAFRKGNCGDVGRISRPFNLDNQRKLTLSG